MAVTIFLFDFIECEVKRTARSRRVRLTVERGGRVILSLPHRLSLVVAKKSLEDKKERIVASYERALAHPPRLLTQGGSDEYREMKEVARERIVERVMWYATHYRVTYQSLSIRNQKSRFGSCSARGHLSFNYRLIYLPAPLLDYVVAHEVCHLRELNHSRNFWALVAETIPDFQDKKQQLQAFSRTLS